MIRLTKSQLQPIGLDIGHDSIKMVQLETSGNTLSVHAAARQTLSDDLKAQSAEAPELFLAGSVDLIKQMLRGGRAGGAGGTFYGRGVVAALPRQIVHVKNLRLPQIPPKSSPPPLSSRPAISSPSTPTRPRSGSFMPGRCARGRTSSSR